MKITLRLLLSVLALSFSFRHAFAQGQNFIPTNQPVVLGETYLVGTYNFGDEEGDPKIDRFLIIGTDSIFLWSTTPNRSAYWHCDRIGHVQSKLTIMISRFGSPGILFVDVIGTATGISDSMVRMRPRSWTVVMTPDSIHGGWNGTTNPELYNKISIPTNFTDWSLLVDSSLGYLMTVAKDSLPITTLSANPFEVGTVNLSFHSKRGPTHGDTSYAATLLIHVKNTNQDSVYRQHITFVMKTAPNIQYARLEPPSVTFIGKAGIPDSQVVLLHHVHSITNFTITKPRYPYSMTMYDRDDSTKVIIVRSSVASSGAYQFVDQIHFIAADFNGDVGDDSVSLTMKTSIDNSTDKSFWHATSLPGPSDSILAIAIDTSGRVFASSKGLFVSSDFGNTWDTTGMHNSGIVAVCVDPQNQVDCQFGNQLGCSSDGGRTWHDPNLSASVGTQVGTFTFPFYPYSLTQNMTESPATVAEFSSLLQPDDYYEFVERIFRRSFDSLNWSVVGTPPGDARISLLYGSSIVSAHFDTLWADSRICFLPSSLSSMQATPNGDLYIGTQSNGVLLLPKDSSILQPTNLDYGQITSLACTEAGEVFATTWGNGVYYSSDRGVTWYGRNAGLSTKFVNAIAVRDGQFAYLATPASGVYRSVNPVEQKARNTVSSLAQNLSGNTLACYPNPASDRITFGYSLSEPGEVTISVYDALGRVVQNCASEYRAAGKFEVQIAVAPLREGQYFCRLQRGGDASVTGFVVRR